MGIYQLSLIIIYFKNATKVIYKYVAYNILKKVNDTKFQWFPKTGYKVWYCQITRILQRNYKNKKIKSYRKKFINFLPAGVGGLAFNTLEAPFDDIKVREAFCHLWDVEKLMDKLKKQKNLLDKFESTNHLIIDVPKKTNGSAHAATTMNNLGPVKKFLSDSIIVVPL